MDAPSWPHRRSPRRWEDVKAEEARRRVHRPTLESDTMSRTSTYRSWHGRSTSPGTTADTPIFPRYGSHANSYHDPPLVSSGNALPDHPIPSTPSTCETKEAGATVLTGLSPDGITPLLKAQAAWEQERASLRNSCDALQASLTRERAWRAEAEKRSLTLKEENHALRDALSAALGAPSSPSPTRMSSGNGSGAANEVLVPLSQYAALLKLARGYRRTLLDLKALQTSLSEGDGTSRSGGDGLFTAFPFSVPALPHNPLADDILSAAPSPLATPPRANPSLTPVASAEAEAQRAALSLSPSVGVAPSGRPDQQEALITLGKESGILMNREAQRRSVSADGFSTPPRKEGTVTPSPLRVDSTVGSPPPPPTSSSGYRARVPVGAALGRADVRAELARPTTLSGSALKEKLKERGDSFPRGATEDAALETLNEWQQVASSPPPKDPGAQPWAGPLDKDATFSEFLSRIPRIEPLVPGKLYLEVYPYVDAKGREKNRQRWIIVNRTGDFHFTVEFRFSDVMMEGLPSACTLLSDAHVTQDGRCVMTVAPGSSKAFVDGEPGRYTVVVRTDRSPSGPMAETVQPPLHEDAPPSETTGMLESREPSRRSATMPPQERAPSLPSSIAPTPSLTTGAVTEGGWGAPPSGRRGQEGIHLLHRSSLPPQRASPLSAAHLVTTAELAEHQAYLSVEEAIAETDQMVLRLVKEISALAREFGEADNPSAVAALCQRRGLDYLDASFPPVTASLGMGAAGCRLYSAPLRRTYFIRWQPAAAYTPRHRRAALSSAVGVDPCALRVGLLGDAGVVAALAALAEAPAAITGILASTTSDDEANGVFSAWLCDRGAWRLTTVDAYLPCVTEGVPEGSGAAAVQQQQQPHQLFGCANVLSCDVWGSVCEKAMAKVLGAGYRGLRSVSAADALALLTGGPVEVWDWWRREPFEAFDEMEAAINTNARGAGIVLLTTRTAIATGLVSSLAHRGGSGEGASEGTTNSPHFSFKAAGLLPDTSYRVLAASENAKGEPMVLIRNWRRRSLDEEEATAVRRLSWESKAVSPDRGDEPACHDARLNQAATVVRDSESCLWLNYEREVLPFFESCHVCFDCRRYHDVRVPIRFLVEGDVGRVVGGSDTRATLPAIPSHLLRVTVKHPRRQRAKTTGACEGQESSGERRQQRPLEPARMWLGMHQPAHANPNAPPTHGLKLTLLGYDAARTAQDRRTTDTALRPPAYYVLSESYGGEYQELPAVWMYLELEAPDRDAEGGSSSDDEDTQTAANPVVFYVLPQLIATSTGPRTHFAVPPTEKTAFVALLAEDRQRFDVELLRAPEELRAALYHDVLERIDFTGCEVVKAPSQGPAALKKKGPSLSEGTAKAAEGCQVNGRWVEGFRW